MLREADYRKWLLTGLVIAHIAWVANHLRLVANDQLDPWRLGGYGMYTVPSPDVKFQVFDKAEPNSSVPVEKRAFNAAQRFTNPSRIFRCAPVTPEALRSFFDE